MLKMWQSLLLLVCLCNPQLSFANHDVLTLGVLAARPKSDAKSEWQPLADYLTQALQVKKVQLQVLNYAELEAEIQNQRLDFVLTNPSHYIVLKERNALSAALATLIEFNYGEPVSALGGVIFCLQDKAAHINSLADLKDKTVATVSRSSLGGYQAQAYELAQIGVKTSADMQVLETEMPHDAVIEAVLSGKVEAGFVRTGVLEAFAQKHHFDLNRFKIINRQQLPSFPFLLSTRLYPQWPFVAMPHVDPQLAKKVAASLLLLDAQHPIFAHGNVKSFVVAADYSVVEALLRELRLPPFDDSPQFTLRDVWLRYRETLLGILVFSLAVIVLMMLVVIKNRQLRLAQQLLSKSEQQNRLILNCAGEGIFGLDLNGRALFINTAACQMLGYQVEEIIDQPLHNLIHHSYADGSAYPLKQCPMYAAHAQGISVKALDEVLWRKDGSCFPVDYTCNPIIDERLLLLGAVVVFSDITSRKKATEQLANERALFRGVIDAIPDLIFFKDLHCVYLGCNKAFTAYFGSPENTIIGKTDFDFVDINTAKFFREQDLLALNSGKIHSNEEWLTYPDGKKSLVETRKIPYYAADNALLGVIGISHDITETKQLMESMRQAEQAAISANRAKTEFLANMSHEIRTPMNAILGFTTILLEINHDSVQRYYLQAIDRSGKTLLQLINDILDLSKIEAGKFNLEYRAVSLKALLDDIGIVFSAKITEKSLLFSVEIADNVPDSLWLDEIRLRQILLNLVGNAIKFTQSGFIKIQISAEPTAEAKRINLLIAIIDSGIGIPKAQQETIFSAFTQQEHQSTSYGGTGLGLTISRRLLELMGGSISVDSEVGQGSCFSLRLNQVQVSESSQKTPPIPEKALVPETKVVVFAPASILVVDDIRANRLLINAYLQEFSGLKLTEAATAADVFRLIGEQKQRFDLILMDRRLPDGNGDEVCEKIKALPDYAQVPIIMLTANILNVTTALTPFYDLQLSKPFSKAELISALQTFLAAETHEQPLSDETESGNGNGAGECGISLVQKQALRQQLIQDYQAEIKRMSESGFVEIDQLIYLAEQVSKLAQQYKCPPLYDWAQALKSEAELFDLSGVSRNLKIFEHLLENLK